MKKELISKWTRRIFNAFIAIFIIIVGIICLIGLLLSINAFVETQNTFSQAYSEAAASIAELSPTDKELAQMAIEHLEKLQKIQKNAATNDVMSFLYSTLSTILVGLCAGFVAKSYNNAEKAKAAVDDAQSNANAAMKSAEKSKENASVSADTVKIVEDAAESAKQLKMDIMKSYEDISREAEKSKTLYIEALSQMQMQKDTVMILSIHIEIVHARSVLLSHDQTEANQRIFNISRLVLAISHCIDRGSILQLQQELLNLETAVDVFREYSEAVEDDGKRMSMFQSISRYNNELDKAVDHCNILLREIALKSNE